MSKEETIAVAIRIIAVVLLIHIINSFPGMMLALSEEYDYKFWILTSVFVILVISVILLWKFPYSIAKQLAPKVINSEPTNWNGEVIVAVGSTLIGLYFLFYVISDSVYWLFIGLYQKDYYGYVVELTVDEVARMVATFAEFVFAVFLIAGSSIVSKWIHAIRYGVSDASNK